MTAPALAYPTPPPAPYEQPPQDDHDPVLEAAIAALILYFASQAAIKAVTLPARLVGVLTAAGFAPKAAKAAGRMALGVPLTGRSRYGAPTVPDRSEWTWPGTATTPPMARRVAADEPTMRARYVVNATHRLTDGLVTGTFLDDLSAERNHLQAHVQAGRKRKAAAQALDETAAKHGPLLRWVAVLDERTTADCRVLNGVIFTIDNPPGLPGAMHPACRCSAVSAF